MEKNFKNFQILVLRNGDQHVQSLLFSDEYSALSMIISMFRVVSELEWFKSEVVNARAKQERTYTGQNTFECYVNRDSCELINSLNKE